MTLMPAYGQDYKSAKEAISAYQEGKDWIIASPCRWLGAYASCRDFPGVEVTLRYNRLARVAFTTFEKKS